MGIMMLNAFLGMGIGAFISGYFLDISVLETVGRLLWGGVGLFCFWFCCRNEFIRKED